ncbi:MAG: hypothetical protein EOP07_07470 [Proteobacteria bacterium]|nr:MAG: hypothetical protein EOP07_07470 [Pseudomonadota bacterium]
MEEAFSFFSHAWPLMLAAFAAGTVDSMGGGGGLITVPALLNMGVPPLFLLGTNKTISAFGSLPALLRYRKARLLPNLGWKIWAFLGLSCAAFSAVGAFVSQYEAFLDRISLIVPLMLVFVMGFMVKKWFFDAHPATELAMDSPKALMTKIAGPGSFLSIGGISFYDGLLGPGTGAFFMNFLEHHGVRTLTANAATKVFNLSSNVGALIFFVAMGKNLWLFGLSGAFCYALGNYLGAGFVIKRGQNLVRAVVLIVVSILLLRYLYRYIQSIGMI